MKRPVVCLIDTQGAYHGIDAEERGQAEAIAKNLEVMAGLPVPIVCAVIGEGGSGGALALGVANRILMMEYATYSVISPEGCASILWRDDAKKPEAAEAMKMTATDLLRLGIIDEIIPEAPGGAHRDHDLSARQLGDALRRHLADLLLQSPEWLRDDRYRKFRGMGAYIESGGKDGRPDGDARGEGGKSDGKPGEKPAPSPPAAE
jgi:acetyl-CoA carboxylase carboxyl transferase subunit alpha